MLVCQTKITFGQKLNYKQCDMWRRAPQSQLLAVYSLSFCCTVWYHCACLCVYLMYLTTEWKYFFIVEGTDDENIQGDLLVSFSVTFLLTRENWDCLVHVCVKKPVGSYSLSCLCVLMLFPTIMDSVFLCLPTSSQVLKVKKLFYLFPPKNWYSSLILKCSFLKFLSSIYYFLKQ